MANAPKADDFVASIVRDPANPPDTLLVSGYVGASSEPDAVRLYFNPQLSDYVDIPNDAILHSQKIPQESSGLGGSYVWIKSDAALTYGPVSTKRVKATRFLEGKIAQAFGAKGIGRVEFGMTIGGCQSPYDGCQPLPTPLHQCPTPLPYCNITPACTHPPACGVVSP